MSTADSASSLSSIVWATPTSNTLPVMEPPNVERSNMRSSIDLRSLEMRPLRRSFDDASQPRSTALQVPSYTFSAHTSPVGPIQFYPPPQRLEESNYTYSPEDQGAGHSLMGLRTGNFDHVDHRESLETLNQMFPSTRPRLELDTTFRRHSVHPEALQPAMPNARPTVRTDFQRRSVEFLGHQPAIRTQPTMFQAPLLPMVPAMLEASADTLPQCIKVSRASSGGKTVKARGPHGRTSQGRATPFAQGCFYADPNDEKWCGSHLTDPVHNPRKCVSQFFGRNKNETRSIPEHAWVWSCRKHYQRESYENKPHLWRMQFPLLIAQLEKFERIYGGDIRWHIKLRAVLFRSMAREDTRVAAKARGLPVKRRSSSRKQGDYTEESLRDQGVFIHANPGLLGENRTTDDVRTFFYTALASLERGILVDLPAIEALMNLEGRRMI